MVEYPIVIVFFVYLLKYLQTENFFKQPIIIRARKVECHLRSLFLFLGFVVRNFCEVQVMFYTSLSQKRKKMA